MQSAVINYVSYTFSSCFTFVRVLSYCLRVFLVLITFSRYDFSFNHVFSCSFNFLMAIFRFVNVFVYVSRVLGGLSVLLWGWWWWLLLLWGKCVWLLLLLLREREEIGGIVT